LDTLNELAAALGDDPNFATTVTNSIAGKVAKTGDTMTGALIVNAGDNGLDVRVGTDKRILFAGNIGEIGSVAGFQAVNTAGSANTAFGIRATDIRFATGSDERVRITDTGVGIGTDNPTASLDIQGNHASNAIAIFKQTNASNVGKVIIDSPTDSSARPSYLEGFTGGNRRWFIGEPYAESERPVIIASGGLDVANDANFSDGDFFLSLNPTRGHLSIGKKRGSVYGGGLGTKNGLVLSNNTTNGTGIRFENTNATSSWEIWADANNALRIDSMNSGRDISLMSDSLYIKQADGNVGIGTTNPGQKLTVAGAIESTSGQGSVAFYSTQPGSYNQQNGSGGTAWAYGSTGGNSAPNTAASTQFGFHHWDGSAWNSPLTINGNGTIQVAQALMGTISTMNYGHQQSASADKSMAVFGSNSVGRGVALQRDMNASYPDFGVIDNGKIYLHNDATLRGTATYYDTEPGYVGWGRKIESHVWRNWAAQGNYTARLYTPIVHNESNMFTIEIDVYGYSTGGVNQRYVGSGYAYGGSSIISYGTNAILGSLNHRLTTDTHPTLGVTVVCFDLGYSSNNGTSYYNHMRWRYQGWGVKKVEEFVWQAVTT